MIFTKAPKSWTPPRNDLPGVSLAPAGDGYESRPVEPFDQSISADTFKLQNQLDAGVVLKPVGNLFGVNPLDVSESDVERLADYIASQNPQPTPDPNPDPNSDPNLS